MSIPELEELREIITGSPRRRATVGPISELAARMGFPQSMVIAIPPIFVRKGVAADKLDAYRAKIEKAVEGITTELNTAAQELFGDDMRTWEDLASANQKAVEALEASLGIKRPDSAESAT